MTNITMQLEGVSLDVEYESEICKNSNGVGGPATCEVDLIDVEIGGCNVMHLLDESILVRIEQHIVKDELENLK
jgi:hypothetical protein